MSYPKMKLGDCTEIFSGSTPRTNNPDFWDGDIIWVTPKDLSKLKSKFISETESKITQLGFDSCSTKLLPENSVLFSSRAPIGHVAINTVPMCTNQGFKSFVPKSNLLDAQYLYYWLKANKEYLQNLGVGATFKEISKTVIANVEIPLPPLEEQRRIASILDKADELRQKRQQAIENLDQLLQATFIDMFGDPISNDKNWYEKTLGEIVNFNTGKLDSNAAEENGIYPFFTCSRTPFKINNYAFDTEALLLAGNNAAGQYWVKHFKGKFNAYQRTYVLTIRDDSCLYGYLKYVLQFLLGFLQRMSKGSSTKYLTLSILKPIKIPIPSLELQQKFIKVYDSIEMQNQFFNNNLDELDRLFLVLQNKAFSGTL